MAPHGRLDGVKHTTSTSAPWQRSWFHCARGEIPTLAWILSLHVVGVVGLCLLPLPSLPMLAVAVGLLFLGGLGTTLAYHRALAHRALVLNPLVEQVLIFFAVFNGSGKPSTWVAMHRLHHATSDSPEDISSPSQGGFWWAHLRWLWQADQSRSAKYAKDIAAPRYRRWDRAQVPVLALSVFGGLLWASSNPAELLTACLWLGPVRLLWALHAQCAVNSICHLGDQSVDRGSSLNVWWLTLVHMGQGENWHANHHRHQVDPRLGYGWQLDLGWLIIKALGLIGLARRVRDPLHCRTPAAGAETVAEPAPELAETPA
jgi:stearoyl-CoA desaturase (delta-9 desaturase)